MFHITGQFPKKLASDRYINDIELQKSHYTIKDRSRDEVFNKRLPARVASNHLGYEMGYSWIEVKSRE